MRPLLVELAEYLAFRRANIQFLYFYRESTTMRFYKALLTLSFMFIYGAVAAQFRIFAGPQLTTANYEIRHAKQETEHKQGFMAGIGLTSQVEGPLYFAPSLSYSRKGYKVSFDRPGVPPDSAALNNNTTINVLALAPLLQLNFSQSKSHFFFRFGPALDIALSGREVFDSAGGKRVDRAMAFESVAYSPATAYANFHLGYEHKSGLTLYAHYEHGLSNLNNSDLGPIILHRIVGVAVGWKF